MTTINKRRKKKNKQTNKQKKKSRLLRDLDLLLKIRHKELKVWCLANSLREKFKKCTCLNSNKT